MKKSVLTIVVAVICVFCFTSTSRAENNQGVVIDLEQSSLVRVGAHVDDLTKILQPLLTDDFLQWLGKHKQEAASVLSGVLKAKVKDVTVAYSTRGFVFALSLPEGDLSLLEKGEISSDSLQGAFGKSLVSLFDQELQGMQKKSEEAGPQIFALAPSAFFAVEGQSILVGSSVDQVEVSRNKLRQNTPILPIPDGAHQIWLKTTYLVSHAPTEDGPFKETQVNEEITFHNNGNEWQYYGKNNYVNALPILASIAPISLKEMEFFGTSEPDIVVSLSGSVLNIFGAVNVKGMPPVMLQAESFFPFSAAIKRINLTFGGARTSVMGISLPGFYASLDADTPVVDMLQSLALSANATAWNEKQEVGEDGISTASSVQAGDMPFPVPVFVARNGRKLTVGSLAADTPLVPSPTLPATLAAIPENAKFCALLSLNWDNLWEEVQKNLRPGTLLRSLSKINDSLTPNQVKALNNLLEQPFPIRQTLLWNSPDLSEPRGIIVLGDDPQRFVTAMCALIDATYFADAAPVETPADQPAISPTPPAQDEAVPPTAENVEEKQQ